MNSETDHPNKNIIISICDNSYPVSTDFSLGDYYHAYLEDKDAKKALCVIIHNNLKRDVSIYPSLEEIYNEDQSIFEPFIDDVIIQNRNLRFKYIKTDKTLTSINRLAIAVENIVLEIMHSVPKYYDNAMKSMQTLSSKYSEYQEKFLSQASNLSQKYENILSTIESALLSYTEKIAEAISNFNNPSISDELKRELFESYKKWGNYGWSLIPNAPVTLYDKLPEKQSEANKIALRYMTKQNIAKLFSDMRKMNIKIRDLESAIFCFENKQYKACCLILFSLIDSYFIKSQPIIENVRKKGVGSTAIKNFEKNFIACHEQEQYLYSLLNFSNLITSLYKFFKYVPNFKNEPTMINRNFISHGMNKRAVTYTDCIQLFLALYNITKLPFELN